MQPISNKIALESKLSRDFLANVHFLLYLCAQIALLCAMMNHIEHNKAIWVQRYNKKCTFARKSRESLLSSAILLKIGCIRGPRQSSLCGVLLCDRTFEVGERSEVGVLEGTTGRLMRGRSPHSFS